VKHRLHVVIGGYGRVGRYLAHMLEYEGHTVSVIDHDPLAFDEDESDSVIGTRHIGPVFDREVLEAAGIREADCFAAVTSGDNSNIVAARTAKEHYRVPRVIARIYDPRRAEIYRGLGIATIASVTWTGTRLLDMVTHPDLHSEYEFGNGEMKMLAVELPAGMEGRGSADVDIPGEVLLTSVVREGQAILPFDGLTFEKNDVLYISTLAESTTKVERILGLSE